jgi:hypothetical protein
MACRDFLQRTVMLTLCMLGAREFSGSNFLIFRPKPSKYFGSPGWIRTSDHSINSRMLYR